VSFSVHLEFADSRWRKIRGLSARLTLAAERALRKAKGPHKGALTILLTDDAQLKTLNHTFRGKDKATNVLSFPAAANSEAYLGDVALAYGVTQVEARAANKRFADHATHLVVHGVLHLLGHDHMCDDEARKMEALEVAILAGLGIADPYGAEAA
jgi:probable rRNA maturation factor